MAVDRAGKKLIAVSLFSRRAILLAVTGGGAGYIPGLPGTMGTLVAVPLSLGLNRIAADSLPLAVVLLVAAIYCAIVLSTQGAAILKQKDPQIIVIDEIVGFLLANFLAPARLAAVLWSFFLFRFFDIVKVYPTNKLEDLPGGAGIVLDDVMAGLYALICVRVLLAIGWA